MTQEKNLYTIRANIIAEILAIDAKILNLENLLAGLPGISMSGPGTSFSVDPASELMTLNTIRHNKILSLREIKEEIVDEYPFWEEREV